MYSLGLDFGTNSLRSLIVRTADGAELATQVTGYFHGESGVVIDPKDPNLARQHPADYLNAVSKSIRGAVAVARSADPSFSVDRIVGIGIDATGSTPIPVDRRGRALAESPEFARDPNAYAWLWKDHTAFAEARALTDAAAISHPEYLAKCGGAYNSEWFWAKIWRCAKIAPHVTSAAHSWVELSDWIPAILSGTEGDPIRNACAAGHKGLHHPAWGGYPARSFLANLHPYLGQLRDRIGYPRVTTIAEKVGRLTDDWAVRTGLPAGIPIATGALDAHMGAVGAGIAPGVLVKILGTSTCDILVHPIPRPGNQSTPLPDIPGLSGIVPESVLPAHYGLEAGQSAVGDLFNWFLARCAPAGSTHESLSQEAASLKPGESGLLALDWNNGNRTILADPRLTGLLLGQTLATRASEIYRALIEATAFGARIIMDRLHEYHVSVDRVVNCGGIAEKSPLILQIYADITGRPMHVSRSAQTCALGSAIAAAVVGGVYPSIPAAQTTMTGLKSIVYHPRPQAVATYNELFELYRSLHDAFGIGSLRVPPAQIMKRLLDIRDRVRNET